MHVRARVSDREDLDAQLDVVGELGQQDDDAILEVFERHAAIELPEEGVSERGVIARGHVAKPVDQKS
jgi:hypothetical protein